MVRVPFALAALLPLLLLVQEPNAAAADNDIFSKILKIIAEKNVRSVDELVPLLPPELLRNYSLIYKTQSPFQAASFEKPRVVLFDRQGKAFLTMTSSSGERGGNFLEMIVFDEATKTYQPRAIDFNKVAKFTSEELKNLPRLATGAIANSATVERLAQMGIHAEPATCLHCHGQGKLFRPIWEGYPFWPGAYGSFDFRDIDDKDLDKALAEYNHGHGIPERESAEFIKNKPSWLASPRMKYLPGLEKATVLKLAKINGELNNAIKLGNLPRIGEVLADLPERELGQFIDSFLSTKHGAAPALQLGSYRAALSGENTPEGDSFFTSLSKSDKKKLADQAQFAGEPLIYPKLETKLQNMHPHAKVYLPLYTRLKKLGLDSTFHSFTTGFDRESVNMVTADISKNKGVPREIYESFEQSLRARYPEIFKSVNPPQFLSALLQRISPEFTRSDSLFKEMLSEDPSTRELAFREFEKDHLFLKASDFFHKLPQISRMQSPKNRASILRIISELDSYRAREMMNLPFTKWLKAELGDESVVRSLRGESREKIFDILKKSCREFKFCTEAEAQEMLEKHEIEINKCGNLYRFN